ncbi:hypothetical protein ACX3YC_24480 [Pseudomonas mohnii]|uniref:hypothetical protein n=1 Tax=Pseudomonas TaxID=286 RepID=UPI000A955A2E|nr:MULTISPECIES: hypothetical protein [Pseudomonas]MBM6447583.1 hypothetical protein [Pseudomonas sp. MIL9]RZO07065.1 hypothetical protein EKG40_16470 [Pseudomonas moorei]
MSWLRHFSFMRGLYAQVAGHLFRQFSMSRGGFKMDDYQEELLEYQAFELDPLEPAEDATEL